MLLVKKAHKDLLEGLSTRCDAVRNFLQLFKPGLIYEIVALTDVYGPTGWDPNIQALVVSKETLPGATSSASSYVLLIVYASMFQLQPSVPRKVYHPWRLLLLT